MNIKYRCIIYNAFHNFQLSIFNSQFMQKLRVDICVGSVFFDKLTARLYVVAHKH